MQKINISIPEPCHENWSEMTPTEKGRHCSKCNKEVVDFTDYTEEKFNESLYGYYQSRTDICGRFNNDQLTVSEPGLASIQVAYQKLSFRQQVLLVFCLVLFLGGFSSCKSTQEPLDKTTGPMVVEHITDTTVEKTVGEVKIVDKGVQDSSITINNPLTYREEVLGGAPIFHEPGLIVTDFTGTVSFIKPADNVMLFETGSFALGKKQTDALDALAEKVKKYKNYSIELVGHTDDRGSAQLNKTLSYNRANEVKKYLEKKGVKVKTCRGVGYQFPEKSNVSMAGRAANRRVEIFVKKG